MSSSGAKAASQSSYEGRRKNLLEQMMSDASGDEACILSYLLTVQEEPFTSTQRSPEMIRHRFLTAGINVSVEHVISVQWSLHKKDLVDKCTTPGRVFASKYRAMEYDSAREITSRQMFLAPMSD